MHSMETPPASSAPALLDANKLRGSSVYKDVGSSKEMLTQYSAACAAGPLASPRGASQHCKYKSGKCANPRATKRNGQLHTLCHFHRVRQNEHQRKSDRKHRMVSVARRAKLGNMGLLITQRKYGARTSVSSNASDMSSDAASTPASPMDTDRSYELQSDGMYLNPYHLQHHSRVHHESSSGYASPGGASVGTPTGRLPPISFLTQPGKLDSFRASSASSGLSSLPPPSSFLSGSSALNAQAGKSA